MSPKKLPQGRVELHLHIDGAMRLSTVWELSRAKKIVFPGINSLQDLIDAVVVTEPSDLATFLKGFRYLVPPVKGDVDAIERIAFELCENQARAGVVYFEGRYNPHGLSSPAVSPAMVVEAMNRGLLKGEQQFGVKARSILCCIIGQPEHCPEVVDLCDQYRDDGVVGIDIAGDEATYGPGTHVKIPQEYVDAFLDAEKRGIHRTMHAGEAGSYEVVDQALHELHAERIGHGYHVLQNETLYKECLQKKVHFEMCPHSSILTGAVPQTTLKHPIVRLAEDKGNFSINTDDPSITATWMTDEYSLVQEWGFNEVYKVRAAFNAARSCFLPPDEKKDLIKQLKAIYGIPSD